ncbi:hypothetical protein LTR64_008111 [Lithohypha guttulata]|uniref:uncharacterized protein n=1 Tax=Lithohypha guttulata TaxID=1690604 RepID=UPI002DE128FB|nr:hypothetical protein LTR51_008019 [Lithohypha guttulata]
MFALYLDIQKQIDIDELEDDEVKGRWKSFVHKWNRGDLAEGWYDPSTLQKALQAADLQNLNRSTSDAAGKDGPGPLSDEVQDDSPEDDDFGPALPQELQAVVSSETSLNRSGPTIPSMDDIRSRNEDARLTAAEAKEQRLEDMRQSRKLDRKQQKERLDEIAPRAEAGTRERQLEKKRDIAASNRAFATSKDTGGDVEVPESDVMGGDDLGELKRIKKEEQRKKTERELKREEIERARRAEREERIKRMKEKEDKTMSMLRELAQARFGDGNVQSATLTGD